MCTFRELYAGVASGTDAAGDGAFVWSQTPCTLYAFCGAAALGGVCTARQMRQGRDQGAATLDWDWVAGAAAPAAHRAFKVFRWAKPGGGSVLTWDNGSGAPFEGGFTGYACARADLDVSLAVALSVRADNDETAQVGFARCCADTGHATADRLGHAGAGRRACEAPAAPLKAGDGSVSFDPAYDVLGAGTDPTAIPEFFFFSRDALGRENAPRAHGCSVASCVGMPATSASSIALDWRKQYAQAGASVSSPSSYGDAWFQHTAGGVDDSGPRGTCSHNAEVSCINDRSLCLQDFGAATRVCPPKGKPGACEGEKVCAGGTNPALLTCKDKNDCILAGDVYPGVDGVCERDRSVISRDACGEDDWKDPTCAEMRHCEQFEIVKHASFCAGPDEGGADPTTCAVSRSCPADRCTHVDDCVCDDSSDCCAYDSKCETATSGASAGRKHCTDGSSTAVAAGAAVGAATRECTLRCPFAGETCDGSSKALRQDRCGATVLPQCTQTQCTYHAPWAAANRECQKNGARLCTTAELKCGRGFADGGAGGGGCGLDRAWVWSSERCACNEAANAHGAPCHWWVRRVDDAGNHASKCVSDLDVGFGGEVFGEADVAVPDPAASDGALHTVRVKIGGANARCCADAPAPPPAPPPKAGPCRRFGWVPNAAGVCSSEALCAWSPKAMWGYQTWARGKEICERQGARQCSIGQLIHGAAAGTGGGYDHWPVWSSTPCTTTKGDPGHWRYAFKTTPRPYDFTCLPNEINPDACTNRGDVRQPPFTDTDMEADCTYRWIYDDVCLRDARPIASESKSFFSRSSFQVCSNTGEQQTECLKADEDCENDSQPVEILQNTFSDRTHCIAQIRHGSSLLLSALQFYDNFMTG